MSKLSKRKNVKTAKTQKCEKDQNTLKVKTVKTQKCENSENAKMTDSSHIGIKGYRDLGI